MDDDRYYVFSNEKKPTRRGVIWLGQTCNLNCYFCYFSERVGNRVHPEHAFFDLEKSKDICFKLKNNFNLNSIDIQGGEPTIYPHIFELLDYCNRIELKPTLITNAVALSDFNLCEKFKKHGVYDFLVSLHGIGGNYDFVVRRKGAFKKQIEALNNLSRLGVPLRVNAVLTNEILDDLKDVINLSLSYKARVINLIGYNNSGDQERIREKYQIPYYEIVAEKVSEAIDIAEKANVEINVRFLPFCIVDSKYRKNFQNGKQKIYDLHEWEPASRFWIDRPAQRQADKINEEYPKIFYRFISNKLANGSIVDLFQNISLIKQKKFRPCYSYQKKIEDQIKWYKPNFYIPNYSKLDHFYFDQSDMFNVHKVKTNKCLSCHIKWICDGFYKDYIGHFGDNYLKPINIGEEITDPLYYFKHQKKIIENEELSWFLKE